MALKGTWPPKRVATNWGIDRGRVWHVAIYRSTWPLTEGGIGAGGQLRNRSGFTVPDSFLVVANWSLNQNVSSRLITALSPPTPPPPTLMSPCGSYLHGLFTRCHLVGHTSMACSHVFALWVIPPWPFRTCSCAGIAPCRLSIPLHVVAVFLDTPYRNERRLSRTPLSSVNTASAQPSSKRRLCVCCSNATRFWGHWGAFLRNPTRSSLAPFLFFCFVGFFFLPFEFAGSSVQGTYTSPPH